MRPGSTFRFTPRFTHAAAIAPGRNSGVSPPEQTFRHFLVALLAISGFTTLCGTDDFKEITLFGQQTEALLRRYSPLPADPPAVDTYRRVFAKRDVTRFNACFMAWMQQVLPAEAAGQRCVDGKTRRGSGAKPLHVVSTARHTRAGPTPAMAARYATGAGRNPTCVGWMSRAAGRGCKP